MENSNSKQFSLNKTDAQKIAKGAMIAVSGAVLTYLTQTLANIDFGQFTPVATALGAVIINALTRYLADFTAAQEQVGQ